MNRNFSGDSAVSIDEDNELEYGPWWPPVCDGFGLPFVAAIFGYQPDKDWGLELAPPANSPRTEG
jgi:hypothetical protein